MNIVLDTNVLIAAALKGGFSEDILEMARTSNLVILLTSKAILKELKNKLHLKFGWSQKDSETFAEEIRKIAEVVEIKERVNVIINDPDDNKILECAVAGKADLIVSADKDLIKLKKFRGIGIVHPKTLSWTFPEYFKKSLR